MLSAAHFLFLSSVVLLARAWDSCSSTFIGNYGSERNLAMETLTPGISKWIVPIPTPEGCTKIGVNVTVCDPEKSPGLDLSSLDQATVHRYGRCAVDAHVFRIVHCSSGGTGGRGYSG